MMLKLELENIFFKLMRSFHQADKDDVLVEFSRDELQPTANAVGRDIPSRPYVQKRVECKTCRVLIGSWMCGMEHGAIEKNKLIKENKFCRSCGQRIDWSEIEE